MTSPNPLHHLPFPSGRREHVTLHGAPEGHDSRVLAAIARRSPSGVLHLAENDARLHALADLIHFFAPDIELIIFPAWDCLPYDRVGPQTDITSQRMAALAQILTKPTRPRIILTTIAAALQRIPPFAMIASGAMRLAVGQKLKLPELQAFLHDNSYIRTDTVRETGDYAVRGNLVDLFPPSLSDPIRIDLFGDEIESLRSFDPLTQRTTGILTGLDLVAAAEFMLDDASIQRFRNGYREIFGTALADDSLYQAVCEGRRHAGMEHWLPLFHPEMTSLFALLPDSCITLDGHSDHAVTARLAQIEDFYQARVEMRKTAKQAKAIGGDGYKPLPPESLYLSRDEYHAILAHHAVATLSSFAPTEGQHDSGGRHGRDFSAERHDAVAEASRSPLDRVADWLNHHRRHRRVLIAAYSQGSAERLQKMLAEHGLAALQRTDSLVTLAGCDPAIAGIAVLPLEHGFTSEDLVVVTEQDILGDRLTRPRKTRRRSDAFLQEASALSPGDLVVHSEHGIGRYEGLETLHVGGAPHDCLKLVYDGGDKLYLPVENIELLTRFGGDSENTQLDRLGGAGWQARKAKVKKRLLEMAEGLLAIAAARMIKETDAIHPPEDSWAEFCARFPYLETDDQLRAINDVLEDLASGKPMDRLICGDVGFGKTEIALRAAYAVAMSGQQVAVVVPTTLLARQHFRNFTRRFQGLPLRIQQISRMVTPKEANRVKAELAEGTVDIVIGTHSLFAKNIDFKRLGLMIIDEEQHFGVKQKEKLKELRDTVHVLTLTATPIPRTLQMSLSGVRSMSIIATPPVDRLAVRTHVMPSDPVMIREALLREHFRGGQSFYVCPRLADLPKIEAKLASLVPELKLITAHGQLSATDLEERMTAFDDGQYDILLATNIIESGLDIPRANTMIVHRADLFGLAQLYQIRGRIGRAKLRGYCTLTYENDKPLSKTAQQRLHVIETLDSLGAGFQLASHDMDIRGAGNLLGDEQSGHIREVGVELFQSMLEQAVAAAKEGLHGEAALNALSSDDWTPTIELGMAVLIPESFVPDLNVRMSLYRRMATLTSQSELDSFAAELVDRFGTLPDEVENLLAIMAIKRLCRIAGIAQIKAGPKGALLSFRDGAVDYIDALLHWLGQQRGTVTLRPDQKLAFSRVWDDPAERLRGVRQIAETLRGLAAHTNKAAA